MRSPLGPPLLVVGATDDHALADGGAEMYERMTSYSLAANRLNVSSDPAQPSMIEQRAALERAIAQAVAHGLRVFLSITPAHPADVTREVDGPQKFADYAALVARAFPHPGLQLLDQQVGDREYAGGCELEAERLPGVQHR